MVRNYLGSDDRHWCKLCGAEYHACDTCDAHTPLAYRAICDTRVHYDIHQAIAEYYGGMISKEDAVARLEQCDLSGRDTFLPSIKTALDVILPVQESAKASAPRQKKSGSSGE